MTNVFLASTFAAKHNLPPIVNQGPTYDYVNQAWVRDGLYVRCGHPDHMNCQCYGRLHEGEAAS